MSTKQLQKPLFDFSSIQLILPGFILCCVIAAAASFVSNQYGGPKFLYALLIGISFHFLVDNPKCVKGIEICAKKLVRVGVALLGVRIAISDISDLGLLGVVALAGGVVLTISFSMLLSRILKLPYMLGLLAGGATGICGISAAMAVSSTLPQNEDNEKYTLLTAIGVAAFSTAAMVLYPLIVGTFNLSVSEAGLFLGGSIHDVAQVVGAGYIISPEVGDAATLAKMFRVAMLMPVIMFLVVALRSEREKFDGKEGKRQPLIPFFLVMFAVFIIINQFGFIPEAAVTQISQLSSWCLVISIAALGVKTSFEKLIGLGWKPIALLFSNTIFIALYMLTMVYLSRVINA
ncbi:putative sulfate exporter family transporter [Parashewanella curva]|uniref:Putative sulfate exporter family transporter n=1 Tax=Parashewanella curva TaxID=2338552 RepID=A0A3L8PWD3_9GAMM|nr:putative sulfate exporter family transporter [Parashewanella curva]RLV59666.1 putative sulfate exporter family transporter [Parashewanella curva]